MGSNENIPKQKMEHQKIEFPAGFRFRPTDEELINKYLVKKVDDNSFCAIAIVEVNMNKCEPWELPELAKMGETEWYFFCVRDRKYPNSQRTNRATNAGYWKTTGNDREIFKDNAVIGMKKTLVFYKGRAPKGEKTNWIMYEYRLEGNNISQHNLSKPGMGDWVICKVCEKGSKGKSMHGSNYGRFNSFGEGTSHNESLLPPLMNSSPYNMVNSFSNPNQIEKQKTHHDNIVGSNETSILNTAASNQTSNFENSQYSNCFLAQEQSMLRMQFENENHKTSAKQTLKQDFYTRRDFDSDISSVVYGNNMFQRWYENQESSSASTGHMFTDCLWNFN